MNKSNTINGSHNYQLSIFIELEPIYKLNLVHDCKLFFTKLSIEYNSYKFIIVNNHNTTGDSRTHQKRYVSAEQ
jgi:hypothetical protein